MAYLCRHIPTARRPARRGFTLIEVMVVVSIIVILVGITIGVREAVQNLGQSKLTGVAMSNASAIAVEYSVLAGGDPKSGVVNHLAGIDEPIDWTRNKTYNNSALSGSGDLGGTTVQAFRANAVERFVWATIQVATIRQEMYASLPDRLLTDTDNANDDPDGFLELRDGWRNKMIYAAFVDHDDSHGEDDFLPEHPAPFFASAGPDGEWGDVTADTDSQAFEQSQDNTYSYDLD